MIKVKKNYQKIQKFQIKKNAELKKNYSLITLAKILPLYTRKIFYIKIFQISSTKKSFESHRECFPILLENFFVVCIITQSLREDFVECTHRKTFASFLKRINSFSIQHSFLYESFVFPDYFSSV
jgi:hypothetical protein